MAGRRPITGGVTLSMTLFVLLLMGGLLAFSAQQQVSELRTQASEFRQQEALGQAEANLAQAIALLVQFRQAAPDQAQWPAQVDVTSQPLASTGWAWQLSAQGGGSEAHSVVRRQLLAYPLLLRRPLSGVVAPERGDTAGVVDPLDYLFGIPVTAHASAQLTSLATRRIRDCHTLDSQASGLLLVQSGCALQGQVGRAEQPLILVSTSGELQLASDARFYGLLVLLGHEGEPSVNMAAGARLYGALVSQHPLPIDLGAVIEHRPEILVALQHSPSLWRFELVAGSWRDW